MRNYPRNSPHAAARLVALALIADGHACRTEFEALARLQVERELGLPNGEMARIVQDLCEDLLLADDGKGALGVGSNDALLADLLTEIDNLDLQRKVISLALEVVAADGHLADGESAVINAALHHWAQPAPVATHGGALQHTPRAAARA